jgi:two-component sensor histidine kinase/tetratricopeptide (TPR) repeat protein
MFKMKLLIFVALGFFLRVSALAQSFSAKVDSIQKVLKASPHDTNRVKILLDLGHLYIVKPGELASDLDTALLLSRQAYALSRSLSYQPGRARSYLMAAQAYRERGNNHYGKRFTQRAIALLTKYGNPEERADAFIELATYYTIKVNDLNHKIGLYEKAVPLLEKTGNKLKLADALKYRGDLYQVREDYTRSLRDLRQARNLYLSIGYTHLQDLYDLLGIASANAGNRKEGLQYGLLALKTAVQFKDSSMLCTICNRLGLVYCTLTNYKEALIYFEKSMAIARQRNDKYSALLVSINAATVYQKLGQEAKALTLLQNLTRVYEPMELSFKISIAANFVYIYTKQKQYDRAAQYCSQLLELAQKVDPYNSAHRNVYGPAIPFFLETRQYDRARQLLEKHLQFSLKSGMKNTLEDLEDNQFYWFKLDSTLANYPSAIKHYQQYKFIHDSLLRENSNKQIKELDLQYKTQEKEHNFQVLSHKSELQQRELKEAQTTRNFMLTGAILLIGLLTVSYNQYRLKKRSHQLLQAQQQVIHHKNDSLQQALSEKNHLLREKESLLTEKEWMLKEIHHRVKNNLQIITSLLHSQGVYLKDKEALSAIRESQNRVHSMALIHQKLYQSDRLSVIPMAEYISEIVDYLINSFDREETVKKRIAIESVNLDITLAVPLGLILNEAITNSLKYAFPDSQMGTLIVELNRLDREHYRLVIADDGVGLPPDFNPAKIRSLGMSLIRGLSKQLGGTLEISQHNGVHISLTFREEKIGRADLVNT